VAGLRVLHESGAAELTVRRVAQVAGSSTMCIYSRFGSRSGMLAAIYRRGFESLRGALTAALAAAPGAAAPGAAGRGSRDVVERIVALGIGYRRFALAGPALYALMFERPLPDFDPPPQLRGEALDMTFSLLVDEVAAAQRAGALAGTDPVRPAYLLWTTVHGITSIELTHALRSPLPGWFVDSPEAGERVLVDGVRAVLSGLRGPG
jgi:AcrR family transcriptional regulator